MALPRWRLLLDAAQALIGEGVSSSASALPSKDVQNSWMSKRWAKLANFAR